MSGFEVQPFELAAAAGEFRDVGEQLQHALTRLGLDVETLLDGWRGAAGASFGAAWDEWHAGATEVIAAVGSMADLLDGTGRGYAAAEQASVL